MARKSIIQMSGVGPKIAIFHLGFFYSGGGEKLVLEEMRGLRQSGFDVTCFAPYVDRKQCFPDFPEMNGVIALLPPPPPWLPLKDPLWVAIASVLVPFMVWRFRSFDIFVGANQPGSWFAFVLSRILNKPYVIYLAHPIRILHPRKIDKDTEIKIREGDHKFIELLTSVGGRFIDWADRASVRSASIVLANGEFVSGWLESVYGRRTRICAAGCHPVPQRRLDYVARWSGEVVANGIVIKKPFILLSNRHVPQKRFEFALWTLKRMYQDGEGPRLVITGQESEYTQQLLYLVDGLRLSDYVHFVGLVREDVLSKLYSQAFAYVYPAPEEDFGMGIVEAMGAGTPVVAWKSGGPSMIAQDGETGFLIDPYDVDAFGEALQTLYQSPDLVERMGRSAHRRAVEHFSYEAHNRQLANSLEDAIRRHQESTEMKTPLGLGLEWLGGSFSRQKGTEGATGSPPEFSWRIEEEILESAGSARVGIQGRPYHTEDWK